MGALSKREARLIALGILVSSLVLTNLVVVQPLLDGFANRANARSQLAARYVANTRLIGAMPRLMREAAQRDAALGRFVAAERDAGTASDMVRQRVQSATNAVGGRFRGSEDVAGATGTTVIRASIRLTAEELDRLIALIENGRPLIIISALSVGAENALVSGRATDLDVQIEFRLHITLPPRGSRVRLPVLLALLLAATAALQLALPAHVELPVVVGVARVSGGPAPTDPPPVIIPAALSLASLFAPIGAATGRVAAPRDPLGGAVVAGVVQRRGKRLALVEGPGTALRYVALGRMVAGWRLVALGPDAVLLRRGRDQLDLAYGTHPAPSTSPENADKTP